MSGEFSDTGNMSPIIVENMVMANIIVTPEKETSNEGEYQEGQENNNPETKTGQLDRIHPYMYI